MQIGVIGLGRVGGNMSRRLIKAGHHCLILLGSMGRLQTHFWQNEPKFHFRLILL